MDTSKYNYINHTAPNIFAEWDKTRNIDVTFKVHPTLVETITTLASKHSDWKLVSMTHSMNSSTLYTAHAFQVYKGEELLGSIDVSSRGEKLCIGIKNKRISSARQRGSKILTGNTNAAIKAVEKNFYVRTKHELVDFAHIELAGMLSTTFSRACNDVTKVYGHISSSSGTIASILRDFVERSLEEGKENNLNAFGIPAELIEKYKTVSVVYKGISKLYDSSREARGTIVVITDNLYILDRHKLKHERPNPQVLTADELPPYMKRSIGMLKLIENDQYVPDIGARRHGDMFYVIDEDYE